MRMLDDRMTVGEWYASAISASSLKVSANQRGNVDVIMAAGFCGEGMGASLNRLKAEYDSARSNRPPNCAGGLTEHILTWIQLKTLRSTREAVLNMARAAAVKQRFQKADSVVQALVGRCLGAYLDPNCHACDGRGFTGGGRHEETGPQIICKHCKGTGRRRDKIGKDEAERLLASKIFATMEQSATNAEAAMSQKLR